MTKKAKTGFIINKLEKLFPEVNIPLRHRDPYTLLIAVILSAQCTDKRVNRVTPVLFGKADTPTKMVKLGRNKIEKIIRTCGLSKTKSKNIDKLSEILLEKFNGKVPDTFADLESLPGVGHKTASVVMSQAFGKPAFPVDTHIHRLMKRWKLSNGKSVVQTEMDCKRLFPENLWHRIHIQLILFGRQFCPARGHEPGQCPVCRVI
ncbi:MAG: endonuclease III [Bacteroidetes bacterium]|nr:endonuclease III [Bacteroidota bacterium]